MGRLAHLAVLLSVLAVVLGACATPTETSGANGSSVPPANPRATANVASLADADRGKAVYTSLCYGCHATAAQIGPSFASDEFKQRYQTVDALAKVVRTGRHPMPQFRPDQLTDQGMADLVAYIKAAK